VLFRSRRRTIASRIATARLASSISGRRTRSVNAGAPNTQRDFARRLVGKHALKLRQTGREAARVHANILTPPRSFGYQPDGHGSFFSLFITTDSGIQSDAHIDAFFIWPACADPCRWPAIPSSESNCSSMNCPARTGARTRLTMNNRTAEAPCLNTNRRLCQNPKNGPSTECHPRLIPTTRGQLLYRQIALTIPFCSEELSDRGGGLQRPLAPTLVLEQPRDAFLTEALEYLAVALTGRPELCACPADPDALPARELEAFRTSLELCPRGRGTGGWRTRPP